MAQVSNSGNYGTVNRLRKVKLSVTATRSLAIGLGVAACVFLIVVLAAQGLVPASLWATVLAALAAISGAVAALWPLIARPRGAPPYLSEVKNIKRLTPQLIGRKQELADIAAFATSGDGYRWITGKAWAGKTALAAWAATEEMPPEVDVVAYFLSRLRANADGNKFLAAVIPQLAFLLGEDPPTAEPEAFSRLWEEALEAVGKRHRHLLLIVDGLDEDMRPPGTPSVAALLPAAVGGRGHVLVTSRPSPDLPADIPPVLLADVLVGHPLRLAQCVQLEATEAADKQRTLAENQITRLLWDASYPAIQVLGTMAAAAGPLAIDDLCALLTGLSADSVDQFLNHAASRTVQSVGSRGAERYQFAHEALLRTCQEHHGLEVSARRQRIHDWAQQWRKDGWPTPAGAHGTTPRYLLDAYPGTLHDEPLLLAELVSDIGWVTAAIQTTGVDAALAELRNARAAAPTVPDVTAMLDVMPDVTAMLDVMRGQAQHLRPPQPVDQPDYLLRQLCLQAAELSENGLADKLRKRLLASAHPDLVPLWTSRRANRALVAELEGQGGAVRAVAVLPDGQVVSGGDDGRVLTWDPAHSQAKPIELGHHVRAVRAVAVLPDGRVVSGGDDHRVLVWDSADPKTSSAELAEVAELGRHDDMVMTVAVTPDGQVVSGGRDGWVRQWNPAHPEAGSADLGRHHGAVSAVAVLPDGRVVSGGHDRRVQVWKQAAPKTELAELGRHHDTVSAVAVLPDGRVVSGERDGQVLTWDPAHPQAKPIELGHHVGAVSAVAVLPDGRVVSGGHDRRVRVWKQAASKTELAELGRHDGIVTAVAVTPDGRVVTGGTDGRVRVWDPGALGSGQAELGRHVGLVTAVAVAQDGRVVSGERDGQVRMWDPADLVAGPAVLGRHGRVVRAVAVLPDGRVVSGDSEGRVLVWDLSGSALVGPSGGAALAVLSDGRVVSGGYDGRVLIWDPADPETRPVELGRHDGPVVAVAVLRDERVVSGGADRRVRVWDLAGPVELRGHGDHRVYSVAVLPDGQVVSGGDDGRVLIWDPAGAEAGSRELGRHDGWVTSVAVLPDGQVVSGGTDRRVLVWGKATLGVGEKASPSVVACSVHALAAGGRPGRGILVIAHAGAGMSMWSVAGTPRRT